MGKISTSKKRRHPFVPEAMTAPDAVLSASDFIWVGPDAEKQDLIARPSIGYWQDAIRRLRQNKAAMVSIGVLLFIMAMAIIVPLVSPYTISEQHLTHMNQGFFSVCEGNDGTEHLHIFGTDTLGRDLFVRTFHGARTSLVIAYSAVFINLVIGVFYGCICGYIGGTTDLVGMRLVEILNGIPYLIIVILMMMVLPQGIWTMVIAYGIIGWIGMARMTRGQILALKQNEFVIAARALGASSRRIIVQHLIPNTLSVVIVNITLSIPGAIFTEAFLSYIGMGVPIPEASWGTLAQEGVNYLQTYPEQLFIPAFFISITMLAFNILGDGLRDAFDPRLRR